MSRGAVHIPPSDAPPPDSVRWIRRRHFQLESLWDHIDFQVIATYDVVGDAGWRMTMAMQPWCEFWLVRAGSVAIEQGRTRNEAGPGQVVLLRSGLSRKTWHLAGPQLSIIGFGFHATFLGAIELLPLLSTALVYPHPPEATEGYLTRMVRESECRQAGYPLAIQALGQLALMDLVRGQLALMDLVRGRPSTETSEELQLPATLFSARDGSRPGTLMPAALHPELERVLQFVASHYHEELSVERLAAVAHLSPKHFGRKFRMALGLSPMDYVRRLRLARARELLCATGHNVGHLATLCGFDDAAHFTRAFKREYRQTPTQMRHSVRKSLPR